MAGGVPYQNRGFKSPGPQRELPSISGYVPGPIRRAFETMPGDALGDEYLDPVNNPSAYGWMMPRAAVRVDEIDGRLVPFDAEGQQLQFEQRPGVLPFYPDRSTGTIEMAVPGILDLIGDQSSVGPAYEAATAVNMARRASRGQYGDDVLSNAAAMDDVPWNPPEGQPVEGLLGFGVGHNGGPSMDPLASVDLPAGNDPRYLGAAPDRSGGDYPRYSPARGVPERMQRIYDQATDPKSPLGSIFDKHIAKGKTLGGEDWYNTEELRDWFVGELGEERGTAEWMDYMKKIGATSTGAKVPQNIRFASFYRALGDDAPRVASLVNEKGITPAEAAIELGIKVPNMPDNFNYGHIKQRNQASNIVKQGEGQWELQPPPGLKGAKLTKWLQANPKVKGFYNDLVGNKKNIAADMHFMRMLAMADGGTDFLSSQAKLNGKQLEDLVAYYGDGIKKYIGKRDVKGKDVVEVNLANAVKDGFITDTEHFKGKASAWADTPGETEYAMYEDMANKVAARYGMTPAQFQASLWMGAGDLTNLADESQGTFMDLFRRSLDKRAGERGLTRKEMLRDFIRNKAPLAQVPPGLLDGAMQPQEDNEEVY